jgi:predicted nucleic acid-binding Zn ribbon protein
MTPLFDFRCYKCGLKHVDLPAPPEKCGRCGHDKFWKLPAAPALQFKGEGWSRPKKRED